MTKGLCAKPVPVLVSVCALILVFFFLGQNQQANALPLTAGNILVTNANFLEEYSPSGTQVQWRGVPYPIAPRPVTENVRDIVVDLNGDVQMFNGTFDPFLTTYDPGDYTWAHQTYPGWSTINNGTYGGIGSYLNFIYLTDMVIGGDEAGIIRFNTKDSTFQRFAASFEFIDLTIGMDGLFYGLQPDEVTINIYDPLSMELVNMLRLQTGVRGIAVNRIGEIFGASLDDNIYHFDTNGILKNSIYSGFWDLTDIDISPDGKLVVGSRFGGVILTDESLTGVSSFTAGSGVTFAAFVPPAVPEGLAWSDDINFTSSANYSWLPSIAAADNGSVHAVWSESRDWQGFDYDDTYYRRSTDNGSTWSDAIKLSGSYGYAQDIAASGDAVYVLWDDEDGLYFRASRDNGVTWELAQKLSSNINGPASIAASAELVFATWNGSAGEDQQIFFSASENGGVTWSEPAQVTFLEGGSYSPSLLVTRRSIHVVYYGSRNGIYGIFYRRSLDGGATWSDEASIPGFSESLPDVAGAYAARISGIDKTVHVVAFRQALRAANAYEIVYTRSIDQGETWSDVVVLDEGLFSIYPDIDVQGDDVYVVWDSQKTLDQEIYIKQSADGGLTWGPEARLTFDAAYSMGPRVKASASAAHVVWTDSRDGTPEQYNSEIYYKRGSSVPLAPVSIPAPFQPIPPTPAPSPPPPSGGGGGGGGGGGPSPSSPATTAAQEASSGFGTIAGRVVNAAWQVIPNATIRVDDIPVTFDIRDGHFEAGLIPVGPHTIYYDTPGYQSQTQYVEIKKDETSQLPACLLSPIGTVAGVTTGVGEILGRVVNQAWQTIPGTAVRINNSVVPTNPGGEFRFTLVYPGVYTVYYDALEYAGQTQVIEVRPGQVTRSPTVILSKGVGVSSTTGEIFGRVVNQAGQMIPGTCIRINATLMPTNPVGEFRFSLVHPGVYTIYYDAPGYGGQTQVVVVEAGQVTQPPTVIMSR